MTEVHIDSNIFHRRLSIIQKNLAEKKESFSGLLFIVGAADDENTYQKTTVLQTWLLGYEFVHTGIFITEDKCLFITNEGKSKYLTHLTTKPTANSSEVEIWTTTKDSEKNKQVIKRLVDEIEKISSEQRPIGHVSKDTYKGRLINEWNEVISGITIPFTDCALLLSNSMEVKDSEEFANIRLASKASTVMMDNFANEMVAMVDEELNISHSKLSEKIEDTIDNSRWYTKSAMGKKLLQSVTEFDPSYVDWCYSPIIQSGKEYDLRPSAQSNNSRLADEGPIISSLGIRYKSYCSNVARTFFIDPTKTMEENYEFLVQLQSHIVSTLLRDGSVASDVYGGALEYIKSKNPSLVSNFTKNCGWSMGIEFRDSTLVLNSKCQRKLVSGEIFSLTIGFDKIPKDTENSANGTYGILLSDTFKITDSEPILLSTYPKAKSEVMFYFKNEGNQVKKENGSDKKLKTEKHLNIEKKLAVNEANSRFLKSKLRNESIANDDTLNAEKIRQEIQTKLHEKRLQEGLARFSKADATDDSEIKPTFKKYESYIRESQIPSNVRDMKIHVDYKSQTIILPIAGRPVPFHINSFKNGSQNEEGDYTYLRLNFNSPGTVGIGSKRTELPYEDSPDNSFLRSITFRSRDRQRMIDVYKAIQDLKKDAVKKEQERKHMADVVTQANLVELKGSRMKRLENVYVRPQPDTKKVGGALQIHENGIRYQSLVRSEQKVDLLFSNVKHLFFQPCKDELIVIIHFHLKNPIMVGKKKTYDIQFYREASDMAFDETGGRKRRYRYGDEDELQQEQEERRRKALLDKEFKSFAELIADSSNGAIDLDIPFRELGFQGVPFRSAVFCMPTRDCLIQLIDPPYLIVTLDEIEIAHFERVQFGLKNFDMVFVFKDFSKPVVHINTIPIEVLEDVKQWLTDVDIPISESRMNLNWTTIMKSVQSDPYQFFVDGGWIHLAGSGDSSEEEEEEEESEFEASDLDPSDESVESEESDDYSDGSGSEESFDESEDGEDWDEMEKKAAREDKERRMD